MPRKLKSSALRSDAVTVANIPNGEITAAKLHDTAISEKLGYTPVSPTTLSSAVASVDLTGLATETYVDTAISNLVDTAPTALNTLNELAAALGDDANFASTITTSLGGKVDKINITGASVGSTTQIPVITYNAQGQITATTTAALDLSTKVNKSGDTMTGTLNVPSLEIDSVTQFSLKKHGDVSSVADLNDQSIRNSVFYSLNPINAAHTNNGVGLYLSSYGLGGSNDDSSNERAAQLYFGDTPASGMFYRVKQGSAGWHPWVALSSGIRGIWYSSTNAHTYTTTNAGFTTLETTFVRTNPSSSSKFLIIATVAGAAADDAHARLEFYDGTNWVVPAELIGQGNTGNGYANGSFGDFSITRATEDKQILQYTATIMHSPASTASTLGYRVRMMAENTNGLYMNRPMGWDNGFNSNTSRSSIIIMEMTGNNNG
jgi:hypothetical protein